MDLTPEAYEEIEAYLKNRLPPPERDAFERRLADNEALRREVALQRRLDDGLDAALLRRRFAVARREQLQYRRRRQRTTYALAAAISVVLLTTVGVLVQSLRPSPAQRAFREFYEPELPFRQDVASAALTDALTEYYAGRYDEALRRLSALPDDLSGQVPYYRGLSLLALNRPAEAESHLRQARQGSDPVIRRRADWYLALTYLRADDTTRAAPQFRRIAADTLHPFHDRATDLLRQLP